MAEPEKPQPRPAKKDEQQKLTFWEVTASVLAAAIGVQKNKNRERDFSRARPGTYVIAGIIFTLLFVIGLMLIVQLVLKTTTG